MGRALRLGAALALAACGAGCPLFFDVDSVQLASPDVVADARSQEMGTDFGRDLGTDLSDDVSDIGPDDAGEVGTCVPEPGTIEGNCSPVAQDCAGDLFCDFQVVSTEPVVFETRCRPPDDSLDYSLQEGEACETNPTDKTCAIGLKCRIDRCARLCRLDDGTGCAPGQVCAEFSSDIPEYGICADTC